MIKVNGVQIATPATCQVSIQDLSKAERNANGTMVIERIATKRKIEMGWGYLTQSQLAQLLQLIQAVFFIVEYPDPQDGNMKTGTFYCGDRSTGMIDFRDGIPRWKDIKFSFVER